MNQYNEGGVEKIEQHKQIYKNIWNNFDKLIRFAIIDSIAPGIAIEWPTTCSYWRDNWVQAVTKKYELKDINVHGCSLGLKTINLQNFIKKPWTIRTNNKHILKIFAGCKCPGHTYHAECRGREAKHTESYTYPLVYRVHAAFARSTDHNIYLTRLPQPARAISQPSAPSPGGAAAGRFKATARATTRSPSGSSRRSVRWENEHNKTKRQQTNNSIIKGTADNYQRNNAA